MSSVLELESVSNTGEISRADRLRIEQLYLASAYAVRDRAPQFVAAAGNIAAGKTSLLRFLAASGELSAANAVRHDPDAVMSEIPEYRAETLANPMAAFRRWEIPARKLAEEILERAVERRCDIVYDRTCAFSDTISFLKRLRLTGYQIRVCFVWADLEECLRRAELRAKTSRRSVPEEIIVQRAEALRSLVPQYCALANTFDIFENHDGSGPRFIAGFNDGKIYRTDDEQALADFKGYFHLNP